MTNEVLTPLQAAFLERFFASQVGQRFFLTGGTALAAFYLHHRRSEDLDLFTLDDLALREADILVRRIAAQLNCITHQGEVVKHVLICNKENPVEVRCLSLRVPSCPHPLLFKATIAPTVFSRIKTSSQMDWCLRQ